MKNIRIETDKNGELQYIKSDGFVIGTNPDNTHYLKLKKINNRAIDYSVITKAPYKNIPISFIKNDDDIEYNLTDNECKNISGFYNEILEFAMFKDYMYYVKIDNSMESAEKRLLIENVYKVKTLKDFPGFKLSNFSEGNVCYIKSFIQMNCWHNEGVLEKLGWFKESIPLSIEERKSRDEFDYTVPLSFIGGPAFDKIQLYIQPHKDIFVYYKVEKIELDGPYTMEMLKEIPDRIIGQNISLHFKTTNLGSMMYTKMRYYELLSLISKAAEKEYIEHNWNSSKIKTITIEL